MDLENYRNFLAVIETGSLTGASEYVHVAQPALSKQIRMLENFFGARLLITERGSRKVILTEAGRLLYQKAKYICSLEEALEGYLPVYTTAEGDKALKNGNPCFKQQLDLEKSTSLEERKSGDRYRMYNSQGIFMGVYEYQEEKHWWKPWKMFMPDGEGN